MQSPDAERITTRNNVVLLVLAVVLVSFVFLPPGWLCSQGQKEERSQLNDLQCIGSNITLIILVIGEEIVTLS